MDLARYCDDWFLAWTGGDVEKLVAWFADDCFYSDPTKPQGVRGKEELRRYLAKWLPQYAEMVWTRRELYPTEDGFGGVPQDAADTTRAAARVGFCVTWTARIPVRGAWIEERGMDLVLLDAAGKIARNEVYFDMSAWKAARSR